MKGGNNRRNTDQLIENTKPWRAPSSGTDYGSWPGTHDQRAHCDADAGRWRLVSETLGSDGHRLRDIFPFSAHRYPTCPDPLCQIWEELAACQPAIQNTSGRCATNLVSLLCASLSLVFLSSSV
jgi:hypothetical protein